jgi:hypothetical protein
MMNSMRSIFRLRLSALMAAAVGALWALSGCMAEATQGGSDTETLSGVLLTSGGKPAAGALVKLVPSTYDPSQPDPSLIRLTFTNPQGRYTFPKNRAAGSYNLLAAGQTEGAAFIATLSADSVPDTLSLEPTRVILLSMLGSASYAYDPGMAWFPGTDLLFRCETEAAIAMKGLPRSLNSLVLESTAGWRHDYTFHVPSDTLVINASKYGIECYPWAPFRR